MKNKINGKLTPLGEIVKGIIEAARKTLVDDNTAGNSTRLIGSFDDVRIYDRDLTAGEIIALYNFGQ